MMYTDDRDRISVEELASFFDQVQPEELINQLTYQKRDGTLLGVKDFFKAHFYGCLCRYTQAQKEIASIKFHLIFSDNILDLHKIINFKKQDGLLKELQDFNLYQNEVRSTHNSKGDGTNRGEIRGTMENTNTRNLLDGTLVGSSSAAAMATLRDETNRAIGSKGLLTKSEHKFLDYLDPNTRDVQQTIAMYTGTDRTQNSTTSNTSNTYSNTGSGSSFVTSSNPFQDRITYLNLNIPALMSRYLEHYRTLFHV